MTFTFLIN